MARETVNLFRVESRAAAEALLRGLRENGLDGSVAAGDEKSGAAIVMFWRPGQGQRGPVKRER